MLVVSQLKYEIPDWSKIVGGVIFLVNGAKIDPKMLYKITSLFI